MNDKKTIRGGQGRPPLGDKPMRRVNVMLDDTTINRAKAIGRGNLSAGIRLAVLKACPEL